MGRWPGTLACPPHSWGGGPKGRRGWTDTPVLPIHGEVARKAGRAGGAGPIPLSSPFMRRRLLPTVWGGGPQRRRGWTDTPVLPIHGEVARRAGGAGPIPLSFPFMGRWPERPDGPRRLPSPLILPSPNMARRLLITLGVLLGLHVCADQ